MTVALNLAKKGKYTVSPNPMVGSIIVKKNRIIGKGYHRKAGKPHAEVYALREAGTDARGSTMYVTLEPCSHWGSTPPCAEAIIKAKVKRVVIGMEDPNPQVCGRGIKMMQDAGIEVITGILEDKARELNKFFVKYISTGLPYVILKAAISLDGKIAVNNGDSKWISNEGARMKVHELRNAVDAIMIGYNTLNKDNPHLTVRSTAKKRDPLKIILAGRRKLRNLSKLNLFKESGDKIIIVQNMNAGNEIFADQVKEVISLRDAYNIRAVLKELGKRAISSVLVEGGSKVFTAFLDTKLVDDYYFFVAPIIIGSDGIPLYSGKSPKKVSQALKFERKSGKFLNGNVFLEMKR